jgi:amino acid adenylation domain-containing protein
MGTLAERPTCTLPRQTVRPAVTALQEETVRPLSFAQERMWLLDQIDPGAATYNIFHTVDISGPLAPALLARSLDEVVRRHQTLRTTFAAPGGAPEPVVAPAARRPLPLVDLAGLPEPSWGPEVARLSTEERRRPFDLAAEPLFRVALVRLPAGRHAGLLTAHPIVFDGGSSLVLWREVAALYEAFAAGRPSPLPELPLQYAGYALWQRLHLAGDTLAGEVDPWRRELAPPLPVLRLPADFDRASAHGFLAGQVYRVLPAPLAAALRELGGRRGATLSSTLLAAWAAVLGRTGGEEDLLVGTPVESRRPEDEGLIGPFRNTLVLRARPRLDRGYGPLVDEVREAAAAAAHQDLPLEMLLTALGLPRDPRRAPPFQVMFLLRSQPAPRLSFAGLRIAVSPPDPAADLAGEVFELGLIAEERSDPRGEGDGGGGIGLRLVYDALLFTEATAARLLDHLAAFLAAALAAPERPLAELPLLSTSERRQLLAWSDGGEDGEDGEDGQAGAQPPLAHHAFLAQAARTPGAPGVVAEGREVSYGELARLVRGLARRLVAQGIGPESRVAIALERSPRMVAAVFAVLTAGGAYVPLDPASPVERLAVILSDVSGMMGRDTGQDVGRGAVAAALLTGGGHAAAREAARLAGLPVVDLDEIWPALEAEPAPTGEPASDPTIDPMPEADREGLAYVIYTSGSTGAPKGVMIRHGGLASYVLATRRDLALTPSDRMLQFASLSFDASVEEIFCCLASGAALILRNDAMLAGAPAFLGACASWGVTVCDLPTVFWQELVDRVDAGEAAWPPSLRLLVFGGERALPERVARLRRQLGPAVRVINSYGPTEVTVAATSHAVHGEPDGPPRPLRELREFPIGRPLPGARAYVLNGARELCPPGIPGELAIGGESLARGYLGRPDLTARTFLPDPFAGRSGARMYTTGDLARHRLDGGEDGALEYLGRIDRQVKLRGYRIELAEIEGVLARHPAVAEAAVGIDERRAGERALVAWWAARPGEGATAAELRGFLKERLPEPAVPSLFVLLPALPRNASGKLDRRALAIPKLEAASAGGYEAPATPAEEAVAYVWRDVLGVPRVGRKDDFFALGGRSLLLPRVRHRLEQELGVRLPLASLLERTTAAALALAAEELLLDELERELGRRLIIA